MAKKEIKSYKRSNEKPVFVSPEYKNNLKSFETSSNIIKYIIIALVLLTIIFSMLPLFKLEVKDEKLDLIAGDNATYGNVLSFDLIKGWFDKANYSYSDRVHKGYPYMHALDYLIGRVPALSENINDQIGDLIFSKVTADKESLLDGVTVAMLIVEIVTLLWLLAMTVTFIVSFFKKISSTIMNSLVIGHNLLTFIMFVFVLALSANSQESFSFVIGVGMWLNLLISILAVSVVIYNVVYKAKITAYEKSMAN